MACYDMDVCVAVGHLRRDDDYVDITNDNYVVVDDDDDDWR